MAITLFRELKPTDSLRKPVKVTAKSFRSAAKRAAGLADEMLGLLGPIAKEGLVEMQRRFGPPPEDLLQGLNEIVRELAKDHDAHTRRK